jgi:hypothetical protein
MRNIHLVTGCLLAAAVTCLLPMAVEARSRRSGKAPDIAGTVWVLEGSYSEEARGRGRDSFPMDSEVTFHEDGTFEYVDLGAPTRRAPRVYSGNWTQSQAKIDLEWDEASLGSFAEHQAEMDSPGGAQASYRMDFVRLQGKLITTNGVGLEFKFGARGQKTVDGRDYRSATQGRGNGELLGEPPGASPRSLPEQLPGAGASVVGVLRMVEEDGLARVPYPGAEVTLDGDESRHLVDSRGRFEIQPVRDGDHSLLVHQPGQPAVEIPFRMLGRPIGLGMVWTQDGGVLDHSGFDGYRFGFIDEDGDGRNDLFADADGNGIGDPDRPYAGYPYLMDRGYADLDGDGVNDHFVDFDGDGVDDHGRGPLGHGFGWVDDDDDGVHDYFRDADGNGICDVSGMPYRHSNGFQDDDGDGFNDLFRDSDGDGVNDVDGMPYFAMPGWADRDGGGVNDFFHDVDGDGINDAAGPMHSYGHGFGWADADGDGINDHFADADGDGVNDWQAGPFADMPYGHGFVAGHTDIGGDGIDDHTSTPYGHGFGWVDADHDGMNDVFHDSDGDGVNDLTGHSYVFGFRHMGDGGMHQHDPTPWPVGPDAGQGDDGVMAPSDPMPGPMEPDAGQGEEAVMVPNDPMHGGMR